MKLDQTNVTTNIDDNPFETSEPTKLHTKDVEDKMKLIEEEKRILEEEK